ncbi:hypothetical protein AB0J82_22420 [Asanoa sp. NPDC049518]|uniref:hypothetical protein n=1 Tax=unclassified Asanoa TaxID=2685164 RepID=UPI00341A0372
MLEHVGDEIEQALRTGGWANHGADPAAVMAAIRGLQRVRTAQEGERAYNEVLDAIGHNHSGWLYDAAGPAAGVLVAVIRATQGRPRRTAIEILIDCLAWVRPGQQFIDADGHTRSVKAALRDAVAGLEPALHIIAATSDTVPLGVSAKNLLEALHKHDG